MAQSEVILHILLNMIAILLTDKTDDLAYNRMLATTTNPPINCSQVAGIINHR